MKTEGGRDVDWTWEDLMKVYKRAVNKLPFRKEGLPRLIDGKWRGDTPRVRPGQGIGVHASDVDLDGFKVVKNGKKID